MARVQIPDTTVFIALTHDAGSWPESQRAIRSGRVWLSSVVVAELYAGTRSPDEAATISRLVASMARIDRLLVPTSGQWAAAGRLIGRWTRLRGSARPRDHLADVLIVVSAARLGGAVVTANLRHFVVWAALARSAGFDVVVSPQPGLS